MHTDPEAGMYVAYYDMTPENEVKANKLKEIVHSLVDNEERLYQIVTDEGDEIEWD